MRNKYPGNCVRCGKHVKAGAGFFQKIRSCMMNNLWAVRCVDCVGKGNESLNDPLESV